MAANSLTPAPQAPPTGCVDCVQPRGGVETGQERVAAGNACGRSAPLRHTPKVARTGKGRGLLKKQACLTFRICIAFSRLRRVPADRLETLNICQQGGFAVLKIDTFEGTAQP